MKDLSQHKPKRVICLLLFLLTIQCLNLFAQSLSVESFSLLENDLTANTRGTMKYDQNGDVAALIKVVTTENDFNFDVGSMGVVATSQQKGEIWVYVSGGVQRITITHSQLGVLRNYYFPIPIERGRTYELKLISGTIRTIVEQATISQFVVFKVEPKNAVVIIDDDEPRSLDNDGMLSIRLERGHHTYKVTAASFISELGALEVENEKITKSIILKSTKATLSINTVADAEIWINEKQVGFGNWTGDLEAGVYLVESRKASHRSQKQEITLNEQEQRAITLAEPIPMYGYLEIESTPLECIVFLDEILIGSSPLFLDKVLVGGHTIRLEKEGYLSGEVNVTVEEGKTSNQLFVLQQGEEHDYVDLGLSVKWSTCNVGANKPEEYGDYFAWGEIDTYYENDYYIETKLFHWKDGKTSGYNWKTYKYCNGSYITMTKYCNKSSYGNDGFTDYKKILDDVDDVAHNKYGGKWRMPTQAELNELRNNCTWTWITQNGVRGYKITSKIKGYTDRSIFLPAAGFLDNTYLSGLGSIGRYWSSSTYMYYAYEAWGLDFNMAYRDMENHFRNLGFPIRPVCP